MNIKDLRNCATASELVLINKVEELVLERALNDVLKSFSTNLERNFHPTLRWESDEMKRVLQKTLKDTQAELQPNGNKTTH